MPKLWNETIEAHRREVRDAIVDTTAALVAAHGPRAVTMSRIADETGIGRATLYRYFPDVEEILNAWHERQVSEHLEVLTELRDGSGPAGQRLTAVLEAYAQLAYRSRGSHDRELVWLLHRGERVAHAHHQLRGLVRGLLAEGAAAGEIRDDVAPDELASYCLHALTAAADRPTRPATERLVAVILAGLRR